MPRSAIIWTRSRELSLKVRYHRTQSTMISWSKVKVPALKELLCRGGFRHRWPLAPQGQLFKFAPDPTALCLTEVFGPIWRAGDSGGSDSREYVWAWVNCLHA